MIACFFIKVGTCAPAPKRRLGACGTRKGRVCYEQLRDARPRRRRRAHSHPLYGSKPGPLPWNFLSPSSVHESPAPALPSSLPRWASVVSCNSCVKRTIEKRRVHMSKTGRSKHRYFSPFPDILRSFLASLALSCLRRTLPPAWGRHSWCPEAHAQKNRSAWDASGRLRQSITAARIPRA